MNIQVTADDIARAVWGNPKTCPISTAIKRMDYCSVSVTAATVRVQQGRWDASQVFLLPPEARAFVEVWDSPHRAKVGGVDPFSFELSES